jgi:hypothetical protein
VGIVGGLPESGVRVDLARPVEGGPPWRYEGEVTTDRERFGVSVEISADGAVSVDLPPDAPGDLAELAEKVRLLARAAWKHAREEHSPPPRHIARWRPGTGSPLAPGRGGG